MVIGRNGGKLLSLGTNESRLFTVLFNNGATVTSHWFTPNSAVTCKTVYQPTDQQFNLCRHFISVIFNDVVHSHICLSPVPFGRKRVNFVDFITTITVEGGDDRHGTEL